MDATQGKQIRTRISYLLPASHTALYKIIHKLLIAVQIIMVDSKEAATTSSILRYSTPAPDAGSHGPSSVTLQELKNGTPLPKGPCTPTLRHYTLCHAYILTIALEGVLMVYCALMWCLRCTNLKIN